MTSGTHPARRRKRWTPDQVRDLGVRTTVPIAGDVLAGLCETEAYALYRRGEFPVPVLRVGRRFVVPVAPILEALGLSADDPATDSETAGSP